MMTYFRHSPEECLNLTTFVNYEERIVIQDIFNSTVHDFIVSPFESKPFSVYGKPRDSPLST